MFAVRPLVTRLWCIVLLVGTPFVTTGKLSAEPAVSNRPPNILIVIADQWRREALGYAGNPDVKTPNLDRLQRESVDFVNAVSGMPVCSPMRASLLTGQRPLTHGVFMNDVPLNPEAITLAKVLRGAGYDTGCIGKWHVDGHGRSEFIPVERRQGFEYWKVLECTHAYNNSAYYAEGPEKLFWREYDAIAQTRDAEAYLRGRTNGTKPFLLLLAWGPPHDPYFTAPEKYRAMYHADRLTLRPNVPESARVNALRDLAGYYAHCTALDDCMGELRQTLRDCGLADNTIVIFTSDHGDMLGSQAMEKKQKPYDESIRVPLLIHLPPNFQVAPKQVDAPASSEDLMPTVLGLCGVPIPKSVEGLDYHDYLRGGIEPGDGAAVISCISPFADWSRARGGREYRALRTRRYTYARDLSGPWLLFDNRTDPYQTNNLAGRPASRKLQSELDAQLTQKLRQRGDSFLPGADYLKQWGYQADATGTIPYKR